MKQSVVLDAKQEISETWHRRKCPLYCTLVLIRPIRAGFRALMILRAFAARCSCLLMNLKWHLTIDQLYWTPQVRSGLLFCSCRTSEASGHFRELGTRGTYSLHSTVSISGLRKCPFTKLILHIPDCSYCSKIKLHKHFLYRSCICKLAW